MVLTTEKRRALYQARRNPKLVWTLTASEEDWDRIYSITEATIEAFRIKLDLIYPDGGQRLSRVEVAKVLWENRVPGAGIKRPDRASVTRLFRKLELMGLAGVSDKPLKFTWPRQYLKPRAVQGRFILDGRVRRIG